MWPDFKKKKEEEEEREHEQFTPLARLAEVTACKVSHCALCKNRKLTGCVTESVCVLRRWLPKKPADSWESPPPPPPPALSQQNLATHFLLFFLFFSFLAATEVSPAKQQHVLFLRLAAAVLDEAKQSDNTYITGAGGESSPCVHITVPAVS